RTYHTLLATRLHRCELRLLSGSSRGFESVDTGHEIVPLSLGWKPVSPVSARIALGTLVALRALSAILAISARRALFARVSLVALRALRTTLTLRTLLSLSSTRLFNTV